MRQARTALADTPGSLFSAKCEALQAEQQYAELLEQLVQHFDLLFSKDQERGAPHRLRLCRVKSCGSECAPNLLSVALTRCLPCAADLECCVNIACHLVPRVAATGQAAADAAVDAVITALTGKVRRALAVPHLPAMFLRGCCNTPARPDSC